MRIFLLFEDIGRDGVDDDDEEEGITIEFDAIGHC